MKSAQMASVIALTTCLVFGAAITPTFAEDAVLAEAPTYPSGNIIDKDHMTLAGAVKAAYSVEALSESDHFKVFARASEALAILAKGTALLELARGDDARCAQVREGVAKYGQAVAIRWARANGYSDAQIRAARRCLIRRGSL